MSDHSFTIVYSHPDSSSLLCKVETQERAAVVSLAPNWFVKICPKTTIHFINHQPSCKQNKTPLLLQVALCSKAIAIYHPMTDELVLTSKDCGLQEKETTPADYRHHTVYTHTPPHTHAQSPKYQLTRVCSN